MRSLELRAYREPGCSGGAGGEGGGEGGGGGGGEVGGEDGDGGGSGGEGGGEGGSNCTTKDSERAEPAANEKPCPKPGADHSALFQPSPNESVMFRVHVAPTATANGKLEAYGAPPISVVPSEQLRLQPTSLGNEPPEQVITENTSLLTPLLLSAAVRSLGPMAEVGASDRARPSNGDCGGDGMPTTAISTGSHCSGQARTKERDSGLLGRPTASE
jgi:hypothetical protein